MALGERIRSFRKQRDWSQDELGQKVGVHGRHVYRWEKNLSAPRTPMLAKLADVFQISLDELTDANGTGRLERLVPDPELLSDFQAAAHLDEEEKQALHTIIRAMVAKQKAKHLLTEL